MNSLSKQFLSYPESLWYTYCIIRVYIQTSLDWFGSSPLWSSPAAKVKKKKGSIVNNGNFWSRPM